MRNKSLLVSMAVLLCSSFPWTVLADWNSLPDTGQNTCYDETGEIPCPDTGDPLYGQDAQYQGPPLSYRDNGDGTVTDLNTGLMWIQDGSYGPLTWDEAQQYCSTLEFPVGGYTDWRLPDRMELLSLVDYGRSAPAIDPVFSCQSANYWTVTEVADGLRNKWVVSFGLESSLYVRCVRSGTE